MLNLFQKKNGAVSVFLVIILVPMITVTALFVDASRMKLSQSLVKSAGDLTLNTVLTQYDQDLNNLYGMMASCQNMNDVLKQAEDYLTACITSQGVNTTDARRYATQIKGLFFEDDTIADVLDIELEDSDSIITPVTDGDLTNPALIKTQIVDFMKYRSPINAAAELLDSLKGMSKEVENLPDETDMTDKKNTFYENEEAIMELAQDALEQINEYTELEITDTYISNMKTNLNGYKKTYESIHKKIVFDLFNTQDKVKFTKSSINTNIAANTKYSDSNKASATNIKTQLVNASNAMESYLSAKKTLESTSTSISYGTNTCQIQYWVHMTDALSRNKAYTNYTTKAKSLCQNMANLQNAVDNCAEGSMQETSDIGNPTGVNTSGKKKNQEHFNYLKSQYNSIVQNDFRSSTSTYNELSKRLVEISNKAISTGASSLEVNDCRKSSTVETHIKTIHTEINAYYTMIDKGYIEVDDAISILRKLKKKVSDYHSSFKSWKTAANKSNLDDSDLAAGDGANLKGDRAEIIDKEKSNILKNVTEENVQGLIQRLENIKSLLGNLRKGIKEYKYNKTSVKDIDTLDKAKKKSGISEDMISTKISELEAYAKSSFKYFEPSEMHNVTNNNNPDIYNVNRPAFYDWLINNVEIVDKDKDKDAKKTYKDFKKKAEDEGKKKDTAEIGANQPNINQGGGEGSATLPSKGQKDSNEETKTGKISEIATKVSDLFEGFPDTLSAKGIMNNLYVTDYITSMFSYDTFEYEGKYNIALEQGKEFDYDTYPSVYDSVTSEFNKSEKTNKANKSLTNNPINSTYCYSYGNEVEYILYGQSNEKNKEKAYGNIFIIRFAFNMGPVFARYLDEDTPEGGITQIIATSIYGATQGIVPEALVKMVICLAATAMESSKDLQYIKKGFGIKLLKSSDELFTKIEQGDADYKGTLSSPDAKDLQHGNKFPYMQYSDYLTLFLVLKQLSSDEADKIYLRTADVIQLNVEKATKQPGYDLSKAQVYYKLNVNFMVSPLMLSLPVIDDKNWSNYKNSNWNKFTYEEIRGY